MAKINMFSRNRSLKRAQKRALIVNCLDLSAFLVLGLSFSSFAFSAEKSHKVQDLSYGHALFQTLTQEPLAGLLPLDVAVQRGELTLEESTYPYIYRADLQFRIGLYREAEQSFLELGEALDPKLYADRLNEIWFRLGSLLYADGQYQAALEMLTKVDAKYKTEFRNYLIDDINLRAGNALSFIHNPRSEFKYYLEYRELLSVKDVLPERWHAFFKNVKQVEQPSPIFTYMIERAKLSFLVGVEQKNAAQDLFRSSEYTQHYLTAIINSLTYKKAITETELRASADSTNFKYVYTLLNIWGQGKSEPNAAYADYSELHAKIAADLTENEFMQDAKAFKRWFSPRFQTSLPQDLDWLPWLAQAEVRQMTQSLELLKSMQATLESWRTRFPFLLSVIQQHQAFYENSANQVDLTAFSQRLKQTQAQLDQVTGQLAQTLPVDNQGLLLNDNLQALQRNVIDSEQRLQKLLQAGLIDEQNFQKKQITLQRAAGRILWEGELQWSDHYRKVAKNIFLIEAQILQAQQSITRIETSAQKWPGLEFKTRLQQLEVQLNDMMKTTDLKIEAISRVLENSAYDFARSILKNKLYLHQVVLQNKLVFGEQLRMSNHKQMIADYELLLAGPLAPSDQAQAWLGLAENFYKHGETDPTSYTFAVAYYKKWLAEPAVQQAPKQREAVLYRVAEAYALLTQHAESIATLEQILKEFPAGQYLDEVQFRLAENAYANNDYETAANYYKQQLLSRPESKLSLKSTYMLGWCQLKLGTLDLALGHFLEVLDTAELAAEKDTAITSLEDDAERVATLVIERAGGVEMLGPRFQAPLSNTGLRAYTLYFESLKAKELHFKHYEAVEYFQQQYPKHPSSPKLAEAMIKMLDTHSFFDAKREQQALFLTRYPDPIGLVYAQNLADYHRSLGTRADLIKSLKYYQMLRTRWSEVTPELAAQLTLNTGLLDFRIADTYFDFGDFEASVPLYGAIAYPEQVLNDTSVLEETLQQRQKAGQAQLAALKKLDQQQWSAQLQASRLAFISNFPQDPTAPALRLEAAADAFARNELGEAATLAESLYIGLVNKSQLTVFDKSVVDLYATSLFNDKKYAQASSAYRFGLKYEQSPRWQARLGNALFILAEQAAAIQKYADAIEPLDLLLAEVPNHELAPAAAFDQGVAYVALDVPEQALVSWQGLIDQYPSSPLVAKALLRLAEVFEQQQEAGPAAEALVKYQKNLDNTLPLYSELTFKIASLYQTAEQKPAAIYHLNRLANSTTAINSNSNSTLLPIWYLAVDDLIKLYTDAGSNDKVDFWYKKILIRGLKEFQTLPGHAQRSVLTASSHFAKQKRAAFLALPIRPPFEKTLPQKQQALSEAIDSYEQLLSFGVSPANEEALAGLGEMYLSFAAALVKSERPAGLSDLALEEYEILLEEQAYDFEDKGFEYHETNLKRLWDGEQNQFTLASLQALQQRLSKYQRDELLEEIHLYAQ